MREKTLDSVISLFGIISAYKPARGFSLYRNLLEVYLNSQFSEETVMAGLESYDNRLNQCLQKISEHPLDPKVFLVEEIEAHCYILSRELILPQRVLVLIYLMDFESGWLDYEDIDSEINTFLMKISQGLNIPVQDYKDCKSFVSESFERISRNNDLLVVSDNLDVFPPGINVGTISGLTGHLYFLRLTELDTILFKVGGDGRFLSSGSYLFKHRTYILEKSSVIQTSTDLSLSYNQIERFLSKEPSMQSINLLVKDLAYKFGNGVYGINKVSFTATSGELMAIMGGSGSGKTTLMNLLIGLYEPSTGTVTLNGVDIHRGTKKVRGHLGFVPQDDALYEDLTSFQNLFHIANLSLNNLSKSDKIGRINQLLQDLGLWKIRNLKVGSPLDKIISGGQRKRLNIALELIRDPGVLLLDEPTSGLSSSDTYSVMKLLRKMANNGRLIIMNIHQPSSKVFKMFDKLLFIDQGGYPVYFGSAMHVLGYMKKRLNFVDSHQNECIHCGNLNPDDLFQLTQIKKVRPKSGDDDSRQVTALRWHKHFLANLPTSSNSKEDLVLEPGNLRIPNVLMQFVYYLNRNITLKFKDLPYLLLSLFLTPLLALILSLFTRNINPSVGKYLYFENENMPAFIFMSVIVSLFVGIMSSATEIIKDRAALKREAFLNLSYGSYFMSKFVYLIILSGFQMLCYTLVSVSILKIPEGSWFLFLILWITAVSANSLGLLMSSFFKSMAAVYVSIPFLLIPQILFSGAVIDFDKINPNFSSNKYVPAFADLMVSRWAFEGIMVAQFLDNNYSDLFYQNDKELASVTYFQNFLIPEIEKDYYGDSFSSDYQITNDSVRYFRVMNGIGQLEAIKPFEGMKEPLKGVEVYFYLNEIKQVLAHLSDSIQSIKDHKIDSLGVTSFNNLKFSYTNKRLNEVLSDERSFNKLLTTPEAYVRKLYPIYFDSDHYLGRAHLYAPDKHFAGLRLSTPFFNFLVVFMFTALFCLIALTKPVRF